jgi:hypothetical protein
VVTGKAYFRATHDAEHEQKQINFEIRPCRVTRISGSGARIAFGQSVILTVEAAMGAGFLWISWAQKNLWFIPPGMSLLLSPFVRLVGWANPIIRALAAIPLFVIVILFALIGWQLRGGK